MKKCDFCTKSLPNDECWYNGNLYKYCIKYNYSKDELDAEPWMSHRAFGSIYFRTNFACENAIKQFKEDLLWYFTEYQPMLYD